MMPLCVAEVGEENTIKKVGGSEELKKYMENLGFVVGGSVVVLTANGENLVVKVKNSRIALSKEMARRIMV